MRAGASTFLGRCALLTLTYTEEDAMSESDTNPPAGLQRHGVGANRADRKALQGPDPVGRDRPVVIGTIAVSEHHAAHLKDSAASMFMFASMGAVLSEVELAAYRIYRDRLLADYGNPRDPIVIMLVEQLALAHLNCGQLFYKASSASSVECVSATWRQPRG